MQLSPSNIAQVEAACNAIAGLTESPALRRRFSDVRLLGSRDDVDATSQHLPSGFLPFMTERQPNSTDVYAFDLGDERGEKVVAWNDHAVVADWPNFDTFVAWLRGDPAAAEPANAADRAGG